MVAVTSHDFLYRVIVLEDGTNVILGLTESNGPLAVPSPNTVLHSSVFSPVALRSDRPGFFQVIGVNTQSAQTITVVRVKRVGLDAEEPFRALPRFKHRGWLLGVALSSEDLPIGPGKRGEPYWVVRTEEGIIGGFIAHEEDTMESVAAQAAQVLDAFITTYIPPEPST